MSSVLALAQDGRTAPLRILLATNIVCVPNCPVHGSLGENGTDYGSYTIFLGGASKDYTPEGEDQKNYTGP